MSTPRPLETPTGAYDLTRDQSVQLIVETALRRGVTDEAQIAYMLATAQHESDDFRTSREYNGPEQARRLNYSGGEDYYGRGYVQTTHDHRYLAMGEALGLGTALRDNPELAATDARLGADLLVVGMQRGLYTGRALDRYVNDEGADFVNARRVVNGTDRAEHIAGLARDWQAQVPALVAHVRENPVDLTRQTAEPGRDGFFSPGERGEDVRAFQNSLNAARGAQVVEPDGVYGGEMRREVGAFQREHNPPETGVADPTTRDAVDRVVRERGMGPGPIAPDRELDQRPASESRGLDRSGQDPMFPGVRDQVRELNRGLGIDSPETADRVAAALVAEWRTDQARGPIDGVVLGQKGTKAEAGEYVFAYSGSPERPNDFVGVRTAEAVQTPVEQSLAKAQDAVQRQAVEAQQYAQAQQQSADGPRMTMG